MSFTKQPVSVSTPTSVKQELNKKRWLVRGLILAAISAILGLKLFVVFFRIVDPFTGFYMIVTTGVLLTYLVSGWVKFKDPLGKANKIDTSNYRPLVSIIVPVKNEEDIITRCVTSCVQSSYTNKEVIIVDDASTDKTSQILDELKNRHNIRVIHLSKNLGKKKAVEKAVSVANGSIIVSMDSDTIMHPEAITRTVKIFATDLKLGAVVGHGRVFEGESGNLIQKMQDVWFDGQFRLIKGAESAYGAVTCCSGSYSAFRAEAIKPFVHAWAYDKFFGREFVFATDRLLTAFVLGYRSKEKLTPETNSTPTRFMDKNSTTTMAEPSLEKVKKKQNPKWNIVYSPSINVLIGVPLTFSSFIKQQIRWRKSFVRSVFSTGSVYWKRPFPMSMIYYLTVLLKIFRPFIVVHSLLFLPLVGDYITPIFYLASIFFVGMIYGVDFRLRNPGNTLWLYRPLVTLLNTFVLSWLLFVAIIRIKDKTWR
jgi:hyaluronan synthase